MRIPVCSLLLFAFAATLSAEPIAEIPRRIPPVGIEIPENDIVALWEKVDELKSDLAELPQADSTDAGVLIKGVEYALRNGEFYEEKHVALAHRHLDLASEMIAAEDFDLEPGLSVHGYVSQVDGSLQPYGLEIPESLNLRRDVPLLVWLHGRGDKVTDMHFIERCLTKSQAFQGKIADQEDCVVLHPFGRQCIGWKHAGEIDVLDAIADVQRQIPGIDPERIILAGFSMGGAGAWHIGAHYTDHFSAVHAGAGFAETREYTNLKEEDFPVWYEQVLWGVYDVPNYARNLLNTTLIAYSGEEDKQKQAADLMARELKPHGLDLDHRIGPGMGHKYHEDVAPGIFKDLLLTRKPAFENEIHLQTRTLRYAEMGPLQLTGLHEHWQETRVDLKKEGNRWTGSSQNVSALTLAAGSVELDGQKFSSPSGELHLLRADGNWSIGKPQGLRKKPGLQGPIDDAFLGPFLVVTPNDVSRDDHFQRWLDFEISHFETRWVELLRGDLRTKPANEVTEEDIQNNHLLLWGAPEINEVFARVVGDLPIDRKGSDLVLDGQGGWDATHHVPVMIYPNPLNPERYIVLNSGLTFREGHDTTNSRQNPKLPDWAIFDIRQDPNDLTAGKVAAAGFFDEEWQVKPLED